MVSEEDKCVSEEDNPFRKDSFIGLESTQLDTVENSLNNSQSFNDPFYSKTESVDNTFGSCDHTTDSNEEENPFRKDSFVLLQEQLASTKELQSSTSEHKIEPSLNTVAEEPLFHDPFLQSDPFSGKSVTLSDKKDTLESLPEEEPRSKFQLITPHSELADSELTDSVEVVPFEYDPFEEEPFFTEHTVAHSHLTNNSLIATSDSCSGFDTCDIPPPLLESSVVDKESLQWHQFDSFDHSFDPHFDTFDHNSEPRDSLFSASGNNLEPFVDRPLDLEPPVDLTPPLDYQCNLEPPVDLELGDSSDKMALDSSAIPDIQDLENAFSLDDLTNVIAEMELVTESLNEEPVQNPPAVAEKPKKTAPPSVAEKPKKVPPPVPTKKYEKPVSKGNEQSTTKKPQSYLNEVNIQKSKEKAPQIEIDIAGDVFSELEAELQQELLARSDQVPDEVKEVLKELNAPYTMGLENLEVELGVKSNDSTKAGVGDLISELHGMGDFENLGDEMQPDEDAELAESGLGDAYTESSMDDLLSELKGMDDRDKRKSGPPVLPKPSKGAKEKTPADEDPL